MIQGKLFHFTNEKLGALSLVVGRQYHSPHVLRQGRILVIKDAGERDYLHQLLKTIRPLFGKANYESVQLTDASFIYKNTHAGQPTAELTNLCTNQDYRNKKLALQTLCAVANECANDGFDKIRGTSSKDGESFYRTIGMRFFAGSNVFSSPLQPFVPPPDFFKHDPERSEWVTEALQDNGRFFTVN